MNVEPKPMTKYDEAIETTFYASAKLALDNQMSVDEALNQFAQSLQNSFPEIVVTQ